MIVFGSRGSDLALCQSRMVAAALTAATGEEVRIEVIQTRGDLILDKPLPLIGGKGLFTEELENALREGRIDAAVHSMKDLPVRDPDGLTIGAIPERRSPHDVLICTPGAVDVDGEHMPLRVGSRIGTSSHRRRSALERLRPDLQFSDIRGNVPTRVDKVRRGDYDAVVLAAAGLDRLQLPLDGLERHELPLTWSTPAPSQGVLAVQCRADDSRVRGLLAHLNNPVVAMCANAEREVLYRLGGGCSMPLGVLVTPQGATVRMQAAYYTNPEHGLSRAAAVFADVQGEDAMQLAAELAEQWRPMVEAPLLGTNILMLRPDGHSGNFDDSLTVAGAELHNCALTRIVPLDGVSITREQLKDKVVAFTSARAVELFCQAAVGIELKGLQVFAGGPATAAVARRHGMEVSASPEGSGGAFLAKQILAEGSPHGGVLFPCAVDRHPDLEAVLAAEGVAVTAVSLYRNEPLADVKLPAVDNPIIVFTSPSAVHAFAAASPMPATHVAIGPSTAAAMASASVRCDATTSEPTVIALIQTCLELLHV
jgi:hydroxymethylbilane synthase